MQNKNLFGKMSSQDIQECFEKLGYSFDSTLALPQKNQKKAKARQPKVTPLVQTVVPYEGGTYAKFLAGFAKSTAQPASTPAVTNISIGNENHFSSAVSDVVDSADAEDSEYVTVPKILGDEGNESDDEFVLLSEGTGLSL